MFNKWRMILLGLVIAQGSAVIAMESEVNSPQLPYKNPLACSQEGVLIRSAALRISAEVRKEERIAQANMYYPFCGYGGNTPPEERRNSRYEPSDSMKPVDWISFP